MQDLTKLEKVGRMLCSDYYNGRLIPSATLWAKVVESVIKNNTAMLELMSGVLSHAGVAQRTSKLGVGYLSGVYYSIDGREEMIRLVEVAMYAAVGARVQRILKRAHQAHQERQAEQE